MDETDDALTRSAPGIAWSWREAIMLVDKVKRGDEDLRTAATCATVVINVCPIARIAVEALTVAAETVSVRLMLRPTRPVEICAME